VSIDVQKRRPGTIRVALKRKGENRSPKKKNDISTVEILCNQAGAAPRVWGGRITDQGKECTITGKNIERKKKWKIYNSKSRGKRQ